MARHAIFWYYLVMIRNLKQELDAFRRALPVLLADADKRGQFALVHGEIVADVFPTFDAALEAGYDRFGLDPFLVKEVTEHERSHYFSRNMTSCP